MGRAEIFVGDLSFFCHENDIFQLFSQYGQVMEVRIKKSEGNGKSLMFGFVKMESLEAADEVIRQLNGIMFMGRLLKVQYSQPKMNFNSDKPGVQIHVGFQTVVPITNPAPCANEEVLRHMFEVYGELSDVVIKEFKSFPEYNRQEGYGFVTFLRDEDARVALNSLGTTEINGVRFVSCLSNKVKVAMGVISPSKLNRPIGKSSFNSSPSISDESLSPRVNTRGLSDNYFHQSIPNLTPPLPYSYANNTQNQTPSHHSRPFQKPQVYGSQYYSQPQYPAPNGGLPQTDHIHSQGNGNFPQMHQPSDGPSQPPASSIPPYSQMQPPPPPHYPYMSNYPHPNAMSVMPINFGQPQMLMPQQPAAMYPTMYSSPPSVNNPPNTPGFYHSQQPSVVPAYPSVHVMYPQQETHAYPSSSSTTSSSMSSRIEIPPYPSDNMHPSATQMQATSGYMHYPPSVNKSIHPPQK